MGELRREMELLKKQCQDPGMRTNWIGVGIALGLCALGGLFAIWFILQF